MSDAPAFPDQPPPTRVTPPEGPGVASLFALLVGVVCVAGLYFAREVLIPITLAVLLSFILAPLVNWLRAIRLGRVPSVIVAVVLGLGIVLALVGLIGTQIAGLAEQIPVYQYTVEHKVDTIRDATVGRLSELLNTLGERFGLPPARAPVGGPHQPAAAPAPPAQTAQTPSSFVTVVTGVVGSIVSPLATIGIVFIVSIFILSQREDLRDRLIRLFGSGDLHRSTSAMNEAARRLSRYFLSQLCINASFGCIIGAGLAAIGIPSPLLWGIVAMLMRWVPYIGTPLAAVLPIALAAAVSPGWALVLWTAALYIVCETITGQVIEPIVYGRSTGLSPTAVIIAAIFWTWLWGPIGLILSTPLTLCLVVLGRHFKQFEFLDVMLGDRPALSPVESFYQRMLAGDPDEVQDQAELLLRDVPLSSYYDEVVLEALQLATEDAARGVLTPDQTTRIKVALEALVQELADHSDRPAGTTEKAPDPPGRKSDGSRHPGHAIELAPPWRSERAILCVAGRGPLDEAAATMLAQLLGKHGLHAWTMPHEAVSRERIAQLDAAGVAMLCLIYLELTGSPAHLRFLLRRLRQRFASKPILVGIWPPEDDFLRDERLRSVVGADYYVSSLHGAVEACLEAARKAAHPEFHALPVQGDGQQGRLSRFAGEVGPRIG
jgi:predicted PurR-regulated permease PerM